MPVSKQQEDAILSSAKDFCFNGWPEIISSEPSSFCAVRSELSVVEGLLLKGSGLIVPSVMRKTIMKCIHEEHQGIKNA